jgi:hypothetical protein
MHHCSTQCVYLAAAWDCCIGSVIAQNAAFVPCVRATASVSNQSTQSINLAQRSLLLLLSASRTSVRTARTLLSRKHESHPFLHCHNARAAASFPALLQGDSPPLTCSAHLNTHARTHSRTTARTHARPHARTHALKRIANVAGRRLLTLITLSQVTGVSLRDHARRVPCTYARAGMGSNPWVSLLPAHRIIGGAPLRCSL